MSTVSARTHKIHSWYLDISLLSSYWSASRFYHHTAPISMIYALHEALVLIAEEGLEARIKRHLKNGAALQSGLEAMGLGLHAQEGHRLSALTAVRIPDGVDDVKVRQRLLNEFGIEIGGGLGPLKGQAWRIGLMGHSSSAENVFLLLSALDKILPGQGHGVEAGAGVAAAIQSLHSK